MQTARKDCTSPDPGGEGRGGNHTVKTNVCVCVWRGGRWNHTVKTNVCVNACVCECVWGEGGGGGEVESHSEV